MRTTGKFGWVLIAAISLFATSAFAGDDEKVARMWKNKCGSCHGVDGKAQTKQGTKMGMVDITTAAWQKEFTDEKIKETMIKGLQREKDGKKQKMDPLGKELKDEEIAAIIKVIRGLKK